MNIVDQLFPASGEPDFQACLSAFPQLEFAKTTPQDPIHHGEGDVWTHTQMVVRELLGQTSYQALDPWSQKVAFMAALLHDISKYSTTVIDPETGKIGQPGHSGKGAVDARIALWKHDVNPIMREQICRIIRVHQVPFFAIGGSRRGTAEFLVRELSHQLSIPTLLAVAEADIRGRIAPDKEKVLVDIELFGLMAQDEDCWGKPRHFADAHTAVKYFRGANVHPNYALHQDPGSKVIVMCGLPAAGKDTWVTRNYNHLDVVSFDDAREELGLRHGKNEGMVAHHAIDKAKALLRDHQPFVWNATHLTDQMRGKTLNLLYDYNAEVEIVHIEKPLKVLLSRNAARDTSLSNKTLESMLIKWEAPLPTEAHLVTYLA